MSQRRWGKYEAINLGLKVAPLKTPIFYIYFSKRDTHRNVLIEIIILLTNFTIKVLWWQGALN